MEQLISMVRDLQQGKHYTVPFVTPSIAVILAALTTRIGKLRSLEFETGARSYANGTGLMDALEQRYPAMDGRSQKEGVTYSRLSTLTMHSEIDRCNSIIRDLCQEKLAEFPLDQINSIVEIVGELHDNVASHAAGRGFSAAQYYAGDEPRLEIAVADAGKGLLRNAKSIVKTMTTDEEAIRWCIAPGNTSSGSPGDDDGWAQQLPDDALSNPYPSTVRPRLNDDNHMGLGLWKLIDLVQKTSGTLELWSGDSTYQIIRGSEKGYFQPGVAWQGVLVNLTFYPNFYEVETDATLESLAEDLGL